VRRESAACVLLDLSLPDAQGLEAVTCVQAAAPEVPIVETPEQLAELQAGECRYAQGHHFARPMPPAQLGEVLAAGRRL
jgi:predicted signal transduction protein with EAL and GGDEF domain